MGKVPEVKCSPAAQRILRVLEKKSNMSSTDLSKESFVGLATLACGGYIKALKTQGFIYVSGWRRVKGRFSTPLYSLGNQADVPRPKVDDKSRDAPGMWRILSTLEHYGPLTYREIAVYSGLSPNTVKNSGYLNALVAQERIHIGDWKRSHGGPMLAIYHVGPGIQAKKDPVLTAAQKSMGHRERRRIANRQVFWLAPLASLASLRR